MTDQNEKTKCFHLSEDLLQKSGLENEASLFFHTPDECVVATRMQLTAMEALRLMEALSSIITGLGHSIVTLTEPCTDMPDDCMEIPPRVTVPADLLEDAGIPANAKLEADVVDGVLQVFESNDVYDLHDVPEHLLQVLIGAGVCLPGLARLLGDDEAVIDFTQGAPDGTQMWDDE